MGGIPEWLWKGPLLWPFLGPPKELPELPENPFTKENLALAGAIGLVGLACSAYVVTRAVRAADA